MMREFKFQLLRRTDRFLIDGIFQLIHDRTVHRHGYWTVNKLRIPILRFKDLTAVLAPCRLVHTSLYVLRVVLATDELRSSLQQSTPQTRSLRQH
jgi:hypothetical protein